MTVSEKKEHAAPAKEAAIKRAEEKKERAAAAAIKRAEKKKRAPYSKFLSRVDELKAYKEKHNHLNVQRREDKSLNQFCVGLRTARRAIISGIGDRRNLTDNRISILDAIGFDWNLSAVDLIKADSASTSVALAAQFQAAITATTNNVRTSPVVAPPGSSSSTDGVAAVAAIFSSFIATPAEIMDKIEAELMMRLGMAVTIVVAPGPLGLYITEQPEGGARIDAIDPDCPFRDKVSVGDLIMTINDKEVKTTADFFGGLLGKRKLFILRWSILGVGVQPPVDVPLLPSMNSSVTAGEPPALLAMLSSDPRKHCNRKLEDSEPAEKKQDAKRYHITMDKPLTNLIEVIPPTCMECTRLN
jgi:hypothetical protein